MNEIVITKIGACWCPPCKRMDKELAKLREAKPDWIVNMFDVENNPRAKKCADFMGIESYPTTFFNLGDNGYKGIVGFMTAKEMIETVEKMQK